MVRIKQIVSVFFVALFMSYYASTTFFLHTHTISGATIVHSHLHTDSHHDTKNGGHTQNEITLIAQISHFEFIDFSCSFILQTPQLSFYENKFAETIHWINSIHLKNTSLRAPPIV